MTCIGWNLATLELIREEKWSRLTPPKFCYCFDCFDPFTHTEVPSLCRIERLFIQEGKFGEQAQAAALYMNRNQKLNWADAISVSPPLSMEKLRTMVETGLLDANATGDISLAGSFLLHQVPHWREALDYLFAKGCSVDIQDDLGRNLLMIVNCVWTSYDHEKTKFLLERGADPWLEDKEGYTLVHIAREYFSPEDQEQFFELIQ